MAPAPARVIVLLTAAHGFSTPNCPHAELERRHDTFGRCMAEGAQETEEALVSVCTPFHLLDRCIAAEWGPCLAKEEVQAVVGRNLALLRKEFEEALQQRQQGLQYGGREFHSSELDSCLDNMPPRVQSVQRGDDELLFWMEQVTTDRGCSLQERRQTNLALGRCIAQERTKLDASLKTQLEKTSSSIQGEVCTLLSNTMGVCLRQELPSCFSKREAGLIRATIQENFKALFSFLGKYLGPNYQFIVSSCSVWEDGQLEGAMAAAAAAPALSLLLPAIATARMLAGFMT